MYNPQRIEPEILKFWKDKRIFDKLRNKNKGKKPWSFIDGPITANNPMGVHHAWGRTYKDLYQRFKALQGYNQRFQNGFDCQGLWLEVETEKELGFNSKKDIERYGLDKFSKACRNRVERFSKIQEEQSIKLGQWMDWGNSYYTMHDKNIESIWFFLKKCYDKKWLYKGTKVLPWCTRCGTSSSQHEMSDEGYAQLTHPSVYVKAKIKGKENEYLLIWTTTEWTLSSNVAAAVNPELDYVKVKQGNEIYYLSRSALKKLEGDYKELSKIKGIKLVGLEYESFYPGIEVQKGVKHQVIAWGDVGEEEGTGIVHIAPTCGAEDYELGQKERLQLIDPALDEEGNYYEGFGWLSGKNVMQIKKDVVEDLKERGILYKVEDYSHRYPVCWRCKEELVFRMSAEWFIKADEIRPLMKKTASKVEWVPKHVGKLMQAWLDNMGDWNISRKRFWGLPLMFFECECGNLEVVGSLEELRNKAVDKKKVDGLPELHRPWIDKIKIKCSKCKKEVSRILDVGDCWLDAGIVPFSTMKYFEDKKYWKEWFPADLVIEMRAQVRLWFYSLLFMSVTLESKAPYKKVFSYEEVRDEKGKPMHKSAGNAIWFDEAVEEMGADVMRLVYLSQNPQFNLNFGYGHSKEANRNLAVIWNLGNYVKEYCVNPSKIESSDSASKWIISKRENIKKKVTLNLDDLQPQAAIRELKDYLLEDLSRTYVRMVRDDLSDPKVQTVLYKSYFEGLRLLSPFLPFITEDIYQGLKKEFKLKEESIHLFDWPKFDNKKIDKKKEEQMEISKKVVQDILAEREKVGYGVRWPLQDIVVLTKDAKIKSGINKLKKIILKQVNIKELKIDSSKNISNKYEIILNTQLTKELEEEGFSREIIRRIQNLRKKSGLKREDKINLVINSEYDLSNFKDEISEKVGAKKLEFNKKGEYANSEEIIIKKEKFIMLIDVLK